MCPAEDRSPNGTGHRKLRDRASAGGVAAAAAKIAAASEVSPRAASATVITRIAATAIIGAAAIRPAAGGTGIRAAAVIATACPAVAVIIVDHGFAEAGGHPHAAIKAVRVAMPEHRRDALEQQRAAGDPRRGRGS